jgi:hypothetical protein
MKESQVKSLTLKVKKSSLALQMVKIDLSLFLEMKLMPIRLSNQTNEPRPKMSVSE